MRFLPAVGWSTFWKPKAGPLGAATTTNHPSFSSTMRPPTCVAHQAASGSGSVESTVIMATESVTASAGFMGPR